MSGVSNTPNAGATGTGGAETFALADLSDVPSTGIVPAAQLGTGSSITTKYLRGDNTWQTISGGADTANKYVTLAAASDLSAEVILRQPFQAYMQVDSTTSITLQRYGGDLVVVNGEAVDPNALALAPSDNLLAADGTDAGANMAPSNLYYVYVSNASASFAPTDLRASATAPSLVNGVKYLNTSGNALNWRFVGWVYANATGTDGEFVNSATARNCINYYNRRSLPILIDLGYVDNNTSDTFTLAATAMARIKAGTSDTATYISNGEDAVYAYYQVLYTEINTRVFAISIGDNSTTLQTNTAVRVGLAAGSLVTITTSKIWTPAEGFRSLYALAFVDTSTHTIQVSSSNAYGGTVDPHTSFLEARVMG